MDRGSLHSVWNSVRTRRPRLFIGLTFVLTLILLSTYSSALVDLTIFGPKRYERLHGKPTVTTDTFAGCATAEQAILKIQNGDRRKTRVKSARIYLNGAKVASEQDFRQRAPFFEKSVTLKESNELKVILKGGHHGYHGKLDEYQEKKNDLAKDLAKLQELRSKIASSGHGISREELEKLLLQFREIRKSCDDRDEHLSRLSKSLDDDSEDDDSDSSSDDEPEIEAGWVHDHRVELEKTRREVVEALHECKTAQDVHDRAPPKHDDNDRDKKKHDFEDLCTLLKDLDHAIEHTLDFLKEIEEKIERIRKKGPSFIIIEIIGKGCDGTPPVISNPEPADGALVNTSTPRISAQYADEAKGTGIDAASARITVDGKDVTSTASITPTGVSYTPTSNLPDGGHTVTVNVSDRANNPATLTWHFTTDTIVPVVKITSHQNGTFLNTQTIALSGTVNDPNAAVTINGQPAQVAGNTFTLANFMLAEGANTIRAEARDAAANIGNDEIAITLDTVLPVIMVSAPRVDSFLNIRTITVTGTITEIHPAGLWINDLPVQLTGENFSFPITLGLDGPNSITVRATDSANNEKTVVIPVTVDTVPPVVIIETPQSGALVKTPQITVSGTVSEPVTILTVDGTEAVRETPLRFSKSVTLAEGINTITVLAIDPALNAGSAVVIVTLDSTAPVPPVITQPASPTKSSHTAITGTAEAGSSVKVYHTAPGSSGPELIGTYPADIQGQFIIPDVTLIEGANKFTATATDTAGNTSDSSNSVEVVLDTKPPVITITTPVNNTYTNQSSILVTGTVDETAAVTINGTPILLDGLNFSQSVTLTSGINSIVIAALDPAGNPSSTTVFVNLDTTLPVATITAPQNGSLVNTPQVAVTGTVSEPVTSVMINNIPAQITGTSFNLTNFTLAEGANTITVTATDRAGNPGTGTVSLTLDTVLPVTSLNAPAQAAAGSNVTITYSTTENIGLSLSELLVNGMTIWSASLDSELSTQNSVLYSISPDLASGTILNIQSRAYDNAGNLGTANAVIQINQGPSGPGYIQGEIYDDTKGLRLEGATADFIATDGHGLTGITTQAEGGYFTEAAAGSYLVTLSKTGFTTVDRVVLVRPEKNAVAIDARLTPVSTQQNLIDSSGARIAVPLSSSSELGTLNLELTVPAGAVTEQADIRLTPVSNQGLAGPLPIGWSPIAVVDIRTAGSGVQGQGASITFTQPASLKIPVSSIVTLTPSSTITVSVYDTTTHQWMVQNPGTVSADGTSITVSVPSTGQYAFVLSDSGSALPAPGPLPLDPGLSSALSTPDSLSASGRVVPPAAPPSVGLSAVGEVVIVPSSIVPPPSGLSSGLIINARVTERFDLFSGEAVVPTDYVQDLVLYRYPCITNTAPGSAGSTLNSELGTPNSGKTGTSFPVTPSHQYTIIDLMTGKVSFEITLPQAEQRGTMVGSDGARLSDTDGNVLVIPQNALTRIVPIETKTIQPAFVMGVVGADFTLLRAVEVNLANQSLAQTAELAIPAPQGLNTGLPIVVAKLIDVRGAGKLKLVAVARLSGTLITSSLSGLNCSNCLNGIITSGTYFFIQAKSSLGFIKGVVTDSSGNPYASALTTSSTCSLVDLTGIDGKYLIAGTVSGFTATATDIYKNDIGASTGTITAASQVVTVNLLIQLTPPRVASLTPADNATGVDPNASIIITFSEPVDKTTVTSANIVLKDASSNVLQGAFSINPDNTVVTIYPANLMKSEAQHTLTISKSIKDLQGYLMGQDVVAHFTVKDTTPPPLPLAGSIIGSFPDANGYVTITATQGSAEATGTVLIMNENSGELVAVKPESNGSFTGKIMAMLGDEIKILSMDQAGNQTLITYITFKSDDGKYLVTSKGGIVEGEGGLKLEIPEGALLGPTVVKITPLAEDQLPHPVPEQIKYLTGVNIDAGGQKFEKEVKLSVPAPSGLSNMPAGSMPFVLQPEEHLNADGTKEKVYVVHDSAKVIDNRLTTASPPFEGIGVGGFYIFAFPYFTVAIIDGYTYRDVDGLGGYQPVMLSDGQYDKTHDLPVKNAVIRSPGAMNVLSYSNKQGAYAIFAEVIYNSGSGDLCVRNSYLTAIHPLTMKRVQLNPPFCEPPYNIIHGLNIKLADASTTPPDTTAPSIGINLQVATQQDAGNENARFTAGTIPVNTNINVPITIIDQEMGQPTSLTVTYTTPGIGGVESSVSLSPPAMPDLYIPATEDRPAVYKYVYGQSYPSPINGCGSQCFRPDKPGAYTFEVVATDAAGNHSTKKVTVRAVLAGSTPDSVDGPPAVDEIIPADGAKEIMVTMPVMVTFSEPVQNVNSSTFKLIDQATGLDVPASVYTSIEAGRMRATLQPKNNLMYGKSYKIVLTTGITDSVPNPSSNDALLPLDHQYEAAFITKVPQVYDLESSFEGAGVGDIALYTHPDSKRSYAYVTSGEKGWHVVDVTDPTKPFVTYSQNMTNQTVMWRYRGAAVDSQSGILAITEWIQWLWEGGSQYGYVRFYDIRTNPAAPSRIGQERLAEAASGVPDKVAISGNFAFVTTLMVGLQVVDIDASKNYNGVNIGASVVGGLSTVDLEECPRPDNTALRNCGSPSDIALIKNNLALIPTFSGSLLIVDVSTPQLPQFISAFRPQGYSAWRIAATDEYAYTDESGNNQVVDLAVTSSGYPHGNIHTIDVTDPTNPQLLGVVKNASGNVVDNIFANDITISKTSGLVYATAGQSVFVIDIKDPKNPVLLNIITETPAEPGSSTTTALGNSPALVEKDGWVYLANQQKGMKVLDLDPVEIGIVDTDTEFTDVVLPGRDYYPALGTKAVTVWGIVSGEPLDDKWELRVNESVANFKIGGKLNTDGKPENSSPATFKTVPGYREGFATLYIAWDGGSATPWPDKITIKLQAVKKNATLPLMISVNASEQYSYVFTMRHNGNVKLQEVLDGKAAFVYDDTDDVNRLGAYRSTDPENVRRFHYVQEMLNQVIPRKRNLTNPFGSGVYNYILIDENGQYEADTYNTLVAFKDNFKLGVNDKIGPYTPGGATPYSSDTDVDNTSPTFRKLMKDYGKRKTGNPWLIDGAAGDSWLYKIIDKNTLVKTTKRIPLSNEEVTLDNADVLINKVAGNMRNDTGLYELYMNVVERFNQNLINLAESYERRANPNNAIPNTQTASEAIGQWVPRTGPAQVKTNDTIPLAVAYSYGGRQTISEFNGSVARYRAPSRAELDEQNAEGQAVRGYIQSYQHNIGNTPANDTNWLHTRYGVIGSGNKRWTGLYKDQGNEYNLGIAGGGTHYFHHENWSGIDCIGLTLHGLRYADNPALYAVVQGLAQNGDTAIPGVRVGDVCVGENCGTLSDIHNNNMANSALMNTNVRRFFNTQNSKSLYYWRKTDTSTTLIHKGDAIRYGKTHISTVHSNRPDCLTNSSGQSACNYEIIHAYGGECTAYEDDGNCESESFSRKVIITPDRFEKFPNPTGFGRIKIWD